MGKSSVNVQVPGAPAAIDADQAAANPAASAQPDAAAPAAVDSRDEEIAQLRARLAAAEAATDPTRALITEADGPNIRRHKAESKHLHLNSTELHALVKAGKVKLTDHHVLCSDGWYVNPEAQKQANG